MEILFIVALPLIVPIGVLIALIIGINGKSGPDPDWPGYQFSCEYGRKRPKEKEKTPVNWDSPGCLFPWLNPELQKETEDHEESIRSRNKELEETYHKVQEILDCLMGFQNSNKILIRNPQKLTNEEAYEVFSATFGTGGDTGALSKNDFSLQGTKIEEAEHSVERLTFISRMIKEVLDNINKEIELEEDREKLHHKMYSSEKMLPAPVEEKDVNQIKEYLEGIENLITLAEEDTQAIKKTYEDYVAIVRGVYGEKVVEEYLRDCKLPEWEILCGIRMLAEQGIHNETGFENDFIVITPAEIVTIEAKNYATGTIVISKDGQVSRFDNRGGIAKETADSLKKKDMIEQSEYHVTQLTKLLINMGYNDIADKIRGIIVIANDKINIDNKSDYVIIRKSLLRHELVRNYKGTLNPKEIADKLQEKIIPPITQEHVIPEMHFTPEQRKTIVKAANGLAMLFNDTVSVEEEGWD